MRYSVQRKNKQSAYIQLYRQLRNDITGSVYRYGDKLPSKRIIAEETGVSVITVEHAYGILCDEGYVEARERSGYFVTYRKDAFFPVSESEITWVAEHYSHRDEDFPISVAIRTMRNVLSGYHDRILLKSENYGCPELRSAISDYLARSRGINVTPDRIVVGSGAEYIYGLIVQSLGRERIYAVEKPSYDKIMAVYEANGVKCDMLKMGRAGIVSTELMRTPATVLHVTPFHSFPSGVTATASKRREYIEWAGQGDRIIVEDDFDSEFTVLSKQEDTLFSLDGGGNVIYVNTFSKTISASMRIGYMLIPERLSDLFREKIGFYSCTVPVFEQLVLAEFLNSGDFERHINRVRRKRRQLLKKKL